MTGPFVRVSRGVFVALLVLAFSWSPDIRATGAGPGPARRTVYAVNYATTSHSDMRALFGLSGGETSPGLVHDIESQLVGEFEEVALVPLMGRRSAWRLRDARISLRIDGIDASVHAGAIAARLQAAPLLVERAADGTIAAVGFPTSTDEATKAYARALLSATQFALPRPDARGWQTREEDQAGTYLASYARVAGHVVRRRIRYLPFTPPVAGEPGVMQVIKPEGTVAARFSRAGELLALDGDEVQNVSVAGKEIARGTTTIKLRRTSVAKLGQRERDAIAAAVVGNGMLPPESLSQAAYSPVVDDTSLRNELGKETINSLLAQLQASTGEADGSNVSATLYRKFKALVMLEPGTSRRLGDVLAQAPPNSEAMLTLSLVLGEAGHVQAQEALLLAVRVRRREWNAMSALLPVLGSLKHPTPATVLLLKQEAVGTGEEAIASTATLALGTLARMSRPGSAVVAAQIVDWLRAQLAAATDARDRRVYLLALGNAAADDAIEDAYRYAHDGVAEVRSAAMATARWIDTDASRALLRKHLGDDPDSGVRLAAARALGAQRMDAAGFEAQRRAFDGDADEDVRVATLENLSVAGAAFGDVGAIQARAQSDASDAVRNAARRLH